MNRHTMIGLFLVTAVTGSARAQMTWHVDANGGPPWDGLSWCTAFPDLQTTLLTGPLGPNDVILVAQGTYLPDTLAPGDPSQTFLLLPGMRIEGGYGGCFGGGYARDIVNTPSILSGDLVGDDVPVACTADSPDCDSYGGRCLHGFCILPANNGENSCHVVTGSGGDPPEILDGFTIIGGNAQASCPMGGYGGGMYNWAGNPTVFECTFQWNVASGDGGGMYNHQASPAVTGCTFDRNSANNGGGMYNDQSTPIVPVSTFLHNAASTDGGGMYNTSSNVALDTCVFTENEAAVGGGGIYNDSSAPSVDWCTFEGNAAHRGGGMYNNGNTPAVANCTFVGNSGNLPGTGGPGGGAMANYGGSQTTVQNSVFSGNTGQSGGAMLNRESSSPDVSHSTFSLNSASFGGALDAGGNGTFVNCIFWGNSAPTDSQIRSGSYSPTSVTYSDIQGGWTGTGNVNADPLFVDADGADNVPGTTDDDVHLQTGSPCVNTGDPNDAAYATQGDIDGEPRVQQCRVDMGADESSYFRDCNNNSIADECDLENCTGQEWCDDCNGNGILDICDINDCEADPDCADCNNNDIPDSCDIAASTSSDCQPNDIPDECETDCNGNTIPDDCDIRDCAGDPDCDDCNTNSVPDFCDIRDCAGNPDCEDCNNNDKPDWCDIDALTSNDCQPNAVPDECETDCDGNTIPDDCDIRDCAGDPACGDCNSNTIPDYCDIRDCAGNPDCEDCNTNSVPDFCDIRDCAGDPACADCNSNTIPDYCDIRDCFGDPACDDCNDNDRPDWCDIDDLTSDDCQPNGVPDECDLLGEEEVKLTASDAAADDRFGTAVSISDDVALVGAYRDDDAGESSGSAYVFRWNGTAWVEEAKLTASDAATGDLFGVAVAINGDRAIMGASYNDDGGAESGSAYVFGWNGSTWVEEGKLAAADTAAGDYFGMSVSISGDVAVVGASAKNSANGAAYVFRWNGSSWAQEAKLTASDAAASDFFGHSVSVDGETVAVTAPRNDDDGTDSGSAYVFHWTGTGWVEDIKLTASDAGGGDLFGYSVSISGDRAIIGAYLDDDSGSNSGSAYAFRWNGTTWLEEGKLNASDGAADDFFGFCVSVSGTRAVIGAYGDDDAGAISGSAYVFKFNGTAWQEELKLTASDAATDDWFGYSVSISDQRAIVGAYRDDDVGTSSGAAYIFWAAYSSDDCNGNSTPDECDIADMTSDDCQPNDIPDDCETDCNDNTIADDCDIRDCAGDPACDDCNNNDIPDWCDIDDLTSDDCQANGVPDECELIDNDCNANSIPDDCDVDPADPDGNSEVSDDCQPDGVPDECELAGNDCNANSVPDDCDPDCDDDGLPNECELMTEEWGKLHASDASSGSRFGESVSLSGDVALIGATWASGAAQDSGSAYVFRWNGASWAEEAELITLDGAQSDYFGGSASISGDVAVVGAYRDDDAGTDSGSAYVFRYGACPLNACTGGSYAPCDEDADCRSGTCSYTTGTSCYRDSDCPQGYCSGTGTACETSADCPAGSCSGSSTDCWSDTDCPAGTCTLTGGSCHTTTPDCPVQGACSYNGATCSESCIDCCQNRPYIACPSDSYCNYCPATGYDCDVVGSCCQTHIEWECSQSGYTCTGPGSCGYWGTGSCYAVPVCDSWCSSDTCVSQTCDMQTCLGGEVCNGVPSCYPRPESCTDEQVCAETGICDNAPVACSESADCPGGNCDAQTCWFQQAKLTASDAALGDYFGESVSIDGNAAIVGAKGNDDSSGSAYVFRWNGTTWLEEAKLTASDAAPTDLFGESVSINGDAAIVGAAGNDDNGTNSGSAYVFRWTGTTWMEEAKLTASDAASLDAFGNSVSMNGTVAIVGARYAEVNGLGSGSAYVFRWNGTTWVEEAKLTGSDAAPFDNFGNSVSINGNVAVVGSCFDDDNGSSSGSAYVFRFNGTTWVESAKLTASDGAADDYFGESVAVSEEHAQVGAWGDDDYVSGSGSAYIYQIGSPDCNANTIPDECELLDNDCNGNGLPDDCDLFHNDCNTNDVPDECDLTACVDEAWCDDCNGNTRLDECDLTACAGDPACEDCNNNGIPDGCDIVDLTSGDCQPNGVPDDCETDCNTNTVPDDCDIRDCAGDPACEDCDNNGIPDGCDLADCTDDPACDDCNQNGAPDGCDITGGAPDGNTNGIPDECEMQSPIVAAPPHNILKNRYISVDPRGADGLNVGMDCDIRVTLTSTLVNGVTAVGSSWWANAPDANCISIVGPTRPATLPNWDACPTLHLTGCPILPTSTFDICVMDGDTASDPPLVAQTQAKPGIKWWGDCVGNFNGTEWTPPQGTTNIDDALAAIKTWQYPGGVNATHVSVTDVHPNLYGTQINRVVNFDDVFQLVLAFKGNEYPGPGVDLCTDP